jgi:zinc transporter, ZIP family
VAEAFGWGALGASALLIGALIAYLLSPTRGVIAVVMALGTGLLIGSVSFELIDEALKYQAVAWVAAMVLGGAAVFTVGDWLLERRGGGDRKDATGPRPRGRPWPSCSARSLTASPSRSCSASPSSRAG